MSCSDCEGFGVLFDDEARDRFLRVAAVDGGVARAPLARVESFAVKTGKASRGTAFFENLRCLQASVRGLNAVEVRGSARDVRSFPVDGGGFPVPPRDDARQRASDGSPASTLDELYAVAERAQYEFKSIVASTLRYVAIFKAAPLKGRDRAGDKSRKYASRRGPATSWLLDVVRGDVVVDHEDKFQGVYEALAEDDRLKIVRCKNRFNFPAPNGYRDLLINVEIGVDGDDGRRVTHVCEIQVHLDAFVRADRRFRSLRALQYFRRYLALPEAEASGKTSVAPRRTRRGAALLEDATAGEARRRAADRTPTSRRVDLLLALDADAASFDALVDAASDAFGGDAGKLRSLVELLAEEGETALAEAVSKRMHSHTSAPLDDVGKDLSGALRWIGEPKHRKRWKHGKPPSRELIFEEVEDGNDDETPPLELETPPKAPQTVTFAPETAAGETPAATLHEFAGVLKAQGRPAAAEHLCRRSLALREKQFGGDHVLVAQSLGSLADCLVSLERHDEAEGHYRRACRILEGVLGDDHLDVADAMSSLATCLKTQGLGLDEAEGLFCRAVAIRQKRCGRDHPSVSTALSNLQGVRRFSSRGRGSSAKPQSRSRPRSRGASANPKGGRKTRGKTRPARKAR